MKLFIQKVHLIFQKWFERIDVRTMLKGYVGFFDCCESLLLIIFCCSIVVPLRLLYWFLGYPTEELAKYPPTLRGKAAMEIHDLIKQIESGKI
jgi:hypothetical protein